MFTLCFRRLLTGGGCDQRPTPRDTTLPRTPPGREEERSTRGPTAQQRTPGRAEGVYPEKATATGHSGSWAWARGGQRGRPHRPCKVYPDRAPAAGCWGLWARARGQRGWSHRPCKVYPDRATAAGCWGLWARARGQRGWSHRPCKVYPDRATAAGCWGPGAQPGGGRWWWRPHRPCKVTGEGTPIRIQLLSGGCQWCLFKHKIIKNLWRCKERMWFCSIVIDCPAICRLWMN